jgi:hypothetical protein
LDRGPRRHFNQPTKGDDPMTKQQVEGPIVYERDGDDLFMVFLGVRVAYRGHPGTPQARTWIPIASGWKWQADTKALTYSDQLKEMHR